jgi:protein-S-isoprenylcysteine O-methyltransferase Ste14
MLLILKNLLFTLVVPASVGIYVPLLLTRGSPARSGVAIPLALVFFTIGTGVYLWSVWNFGARDRATPLPYDAPKKLVIQGPYRYTRNPMYLGVLTVLLGWLLLFQTAVLALCLLSALAVFNLFVLGYEERRLRKLFGKEYEAYMAHVPRWLPRVPRRVDV